MQLNLTSGKYNAFTVAPITEQVTAGTSTCGDQRPRNPDPLCRQCLLLVSLEPTSATLDLPYLLNLDGDSFSFSALRDSRTNFLLVEVFLLVELGSPLCICSSAKMS